MAYSKAKTELVVTYIDALSPSWIKVMMAKSGEPSGYLQAGRGADVETDHPTLAMFDTLWFAKQAHADLVYEQCLTVLGADPESAIPLRGSEVRDCLVNVSGNLGAVWQTTQEVVRKAELEVDGIERQVEALNKSGGLRPLNAKYKAYRIAMMNTGEAAVNYSAYLQFFKIKVAHLVGQNVAAGADKYAGIAKIAPSLISNMDEAVRALPVFKNTAAPRRDRFDVIPQNSVRRNRGEMRMLKP